MAARTHDNAGSFELEYRMVTADGRIVWVRDVASLVPDSDGQGYLWQGMALDITAQKEAQEALAASELRFRTAFENAPIGMALMDAEGQTVQVNEAISSLLGYSKEELLATTFRELTHPDDVAINFSRLEEARTTLSNAFVMEKRYLRKDGFPVWALLTVSLWTLGSDGE